MAERWSVAWSRQMAEKKADGTTGLLMGWTWRVRKRSMESRMATPFPAQAAADGWWRHGLRDGRGESERGLGKGRLKLSGRVNAETPATQLRVGYRSPAFRGQA